MFDELKKLSDHPDGLSHAYLLEGDETLIRDLDVFLESALSFPSRGNPDYWSSTYATFGIDEARTLRQMQYGCAVREGKRIFSLYARMVTVEAQNALLKMFEEPASNVHVFFVTPQSRILLPTLLSRFTVIRNQNASLSDSLSKDAKKFIDSSISKRQKIADTILKEKDKDIQKANFSHFLDALETELHATHDLEAPKARQAIKDIIEFRSFMSSSAPSVKMMFEHLVVTL